MSATIEVDIISENEFRVRVIEGKAQTSHVVTVKKADYECITSGKVEPAELVRRAFEFLLENEPKESILARFDLMLITRYFPNFEREIRQRLSGKT
jgi:Holliday junction resolvase-like predicted endonuclease